MGKVTVTGSVFVFLCAAAAAQDRPPAEHQSQPLYRVTIVSRTTKALNYGYLTAPTKIYFTGTPLLTGAKGDATIEPKRGTTLINAHFKDVPPPTRFGTKYLTYVVWAISPEGRAQNLGELVLDGSNKGSVRTSTPMQTFALIVTAEPYYSVTQPGDVVVMENVTGPDTVGKVEEVNATFELLPRREYTYDQGAPQQVGNGKPVSREQYESIVAVYEAQSAIQHAEVDGAGKYAPEKLARAQELLQQARALPANQHNEIVSTAREATQIAEDARTVAVKRAADERAAADQIEARKRADGERAAADAERAASQAAPQPPAPVAPQAPPAAAPPPVVTEAPPASTTPASTTETPIAVNPQQFQENNPAATENRRRLIASLKGPFDVVDAPQGVVITMDGTMASNASLMYRLRPVADAIRALPGVHADINAHSASSDVARTQRQADQVRQALISDAVNPDVLIARGVGNSRPRDTNATAQGRARNDFVEIVIAGDAIGPVPLWDRTYGLGARR